MVRPQNALVRPSFQIVLFRSKGGTTRGEPPLSKAQVEQRAKGLEVHPTSAEECAQLFIDSAVIAKLGTFNGGSLALVRAGVIVPEGEAASDVEHETELEGPEDEAGARAAPATPSDPARVSNTANQPEPQKAIPPRLEKSAVTLSLTVDATSDPDKLEKQLKLLRQYGVI